MRAILMQPGLRIGAPQRSSTDEMTLQRILRFLGSSPDKIRDGGRYLNGSYADLARGTGLGRSTAVAAIGRLKAHGWLEAERTAHGGAMAYRPKLGRSYP